MKKHTILIIAGIKSSFAYRFKIITSLFFNAAYLFILYYIWKGIYGSQETVAGLTFTQTYNYMAVSTILSSLFNSRTDWRMSIKVQTGNILGYYMKPLPIELQFFYEAIGNVMVQFFIVLSPVILFMAFTAGLTDYRNVLFFILSLPFAFIINFCFEYIIGTISFYTESLWGIIILKNAVVSFLSGGLIPLKFFPESVRNVIKWLPFRGVIDIPLEILFGYISNYGFVLKNIAIQVFWAVILVWISRCFYKKSEKALIVNGG
ncbi:ABC transporter permease [Anaerocolumna xylanovorans]|uniref:ABC-2 type transport system permease protein n=1 Tax=Anaerocolumna xylanovorans DSM 12503 TaxID=1121345 RepID=A0A1M7YFC1_9FIRM|nr:ABC-2 family transporter protein [Anaerocolumna xylanovorans]SHO51313.1 ABC-2 type transport system permease protein [Anaerocolumna xylanovorans DSM 12503]